MEALKAWQPKVDGEVTSAMEKVGGIQVYTLTHPSHLWMKVFMVEVVLLLLMLLSREGKEIKDGRYEDTSHPMNTSRKYMYTWSNLQHWLCS